MVLTLKDCIESVSVAIRVPFLFVFNTLYAPQKWLHVKSVMAFVIVVLSYHLDEQ